MSKRDQDTGITVRHQRKCASRAGAACDCKPTFQAEAYDKHTGRRLRRSFKTITAARRWRSDAIVALRRGELTSHAGPTLNDAARLWLDGAARGDITNRSGDRYKPAAIRAYDAALRLRVLPTLGHLRLGEIRTVDLQRLVDKLVENGNASSTVQGAITPLRAIYRHAVARGHTHSNPARDVELPAVRSKPRRFLSPPEAEALLSGVTGVCHALWATALYTGLRRGELTGLSWDDIDLAGGVIHVRRGWDHIEGEIEPKSRKGRRKVPVPAILRDTLIDHRMSAGGEGRVFGTPYEVRKLSEQVDDLTLHDARHTYASLMIAAGVNAKALSTFMGHANIGVTFDLYGHLMPGSEEESAGLLDSYLARAAGGDTTIRTAAETAAHPQAATV